MLGNKKVVIATSLTPINLEHLFSLPLTGMNDPGSVHEDCDDLPRWIFALPYDYFGIDTRTSGDRPLAWEIKAALIWSDNQTEPRYVARDDASSARFHLDLMSQIKPLLIEAKKRIPADPQPIHLNPTTSDESYLESASAIIASIGKGDFYQVNLLRFFQSASAGGWANLCRRLELFSGPFGCLLTHGSRVIASFSPERFVEVSQEKEGCKIKTWPIKGTAMRRLDDDAEDEQTGQRLLHSEKDLAELRMIIDLMRNDLQRVCKGGTVRVLDSAKLQKFANVWHLEGNIEGQLKDDLRLGELLESLCPGGSITGAPKIAAMKRIHQDEPQARGYFMGNLFVLMHDGTIQSNIMIRTLTSDNWMRSAKYAAGSGLVIKSIPELELLEIESKCAVLTC
jgi:anthranilate/para-aminobenzoate synthase component I